MPAKTKSEPEINPDLLKIMQSVYAEYTGQQIADVIAYIRQCYLREQEELFLEQEIERLTAKLALHRSEQCS